MWKQIEKHLQRYPERLKVARVLVENGLSAKDGRISLNQIEIPPVRIARVAGVDRRTVNETLNTIKDNRELRLIFEELRPAGHSLKEIAKPLNLGVVEITPDDAKTPGILAKSVIVEKKIPGELIPRLLKVNGVAKIAVY